MKNSKIPTIKGIIYIEIKVKIRKSYYINKKPIPYKNCGIGFLYFKSLKRVFVAVRNIRNATGYTNPLHGTSNFTPRNIYN